MASILEFLAKASGPQTTAKKPPDPPEVFKALRRGAAAVEKAFEPITAVLNTAAQITERIALIAKEEPFKSFTAGLLEILRSWPTDRGTGRPLHPEEFHPGFAAMVAVTQAGNDPLALKRYFKEWLDTPQPTDDRQAALWLIVRKEKRKPISESTGWLLDASRTQRYLKSATSKLAWRIRRDRKVADEPWGLTRLRVENLPTQCEFIPELHGGSEEDPTSAEVMEEFRQFHEQETKKFMLNRLEGVASERQLQIAVMLLDGHTHREVAESLGISASNTKSQMWRLRQKAEPEDLMEGWM